MPEDYRAEDFVGLGYDEGRALAERLGWAPRRLAPDTVVTMEYRADRLNLLVDEHDVVLGVRTG